MAFPRQRFLAFALAVVAVTLAAVLISDFFPGQRGSLNPDQEVMPNGSVGMFLDLETEGSTNAPTALQRGSGGNIALPEELALQVAPSIIGTAPFGGLSVSEKLVDVLRLSEQEVEQVEAEMRSSFSRIVELEKAHLEIQHDDEGRPVLRVSEFEQQAMSEREARGLQLEGLLGVKRGRFANLSIQSSKFFRGRGEGLIFSYRLQQLDADVVVPALVINTGRMGTSFDHSQLSKRHRTQQLMDLYGHLLGELDTVAEQFALMSTSETVSN